MNSPMGEHTAVTATAELGSLDGVIAPAADTFIPANDEGLLRGDGAFEVARLYRGIPFAWADHVLRLQRSCAALRLTLDPDLLDDEVRSLLREAGPIDALLRVVITRAGRRLLLIEPMKPGRATLRLATVEHEPSPLLAGVKSLSYAANMLANRIAEERGYDEALFIGRDGSVLEGPTFAFFWVEDGIVHAPPLAEGILDSITRRRVLEAVEVKLEHCTLDRLRDRAEEAFAAGTGIEVAPVLAVEGVCEWDKPGPVTIATQRAVNDLIESELAEVQASLQAP
jgi:branched-chain amino acid aminotransferase